MSGASRLRRAPSPQQKGFTLLEVLVATAILGVAIVTLLGLHARNLGLTAEAENLTIAGALASDVLAITRLNPGLQTGPAKGRFTARTQDADGTSRIYGGTDSERFVWSRDVLPTALPNLQQIRVRVALAGDDRVLAELWAAISLRGSSP